MFVDDSKDRSMHGRQICFERIPHLFELANWVKNSKKTWEILEIEIKTLFWWNFLDDDQCITLKLLYNYWLNIWLNRNMDASIPWAEFDHWTVLGCGIDSNKVHGTSPTNILQPFLPKNHTFHIVEWENQRLPLDQKCQRFVWTFVFET